VALPIIFGRDNFDDLATRNLVISHFTLHKGGMKMGKWAYIATTAGAPMSKTLALAEGTALHRLRNTPVPGTTPGLIHRSHYSGGTKAPHIDDLRVGDEIVLMYDFMDTGLVYPLARFKILDPNDPTNQIYLREMELNPQPYEGSPPLIVLQQGERLQPDYIGNVDRGPNNDQQGQHLALIVYQLSAGPPKNAIGKIFRRNPREINNTILPWSDVEKQLVNEYDEKFKDTKERKKQLKSLVPNCIDIKIELEDMLGTLWRDRLDGRGKQLLINAKHLLRQGAESTFNNAFGSSTLPGYCLIALVEYEMLRLLKKKADIKLKLSGQDAWNAMDLRLYTDTADRNRLTRLPLAPEAVENDCNFQQQIEAIRFIAEEQKIEICANPLKAMKLIVPISKNIEDNNEWLRKWEQASYPVKRARNRIAHSYYLQRVHFDELWNLVCGEDGILKLLHG
jgi:hypothetical protein